MGLWIAAVVAAVCLPAFFAYLCSKAEVACNSFDLDDGLFTEEPALGSYNFDED